MYWIPLEFITANVFCYSCSFITIFWWTEHLRVDLVSTRWSLPILYANVLVDSELDRETKNRARFSSSVCKLQRSCLTGRPEPVGDSKWREGSVSFSQGARSRTRTTGWRCRRRPSPTGQTISSSRRESGSLTSRLILKMEWFSSSCWRRWPQERGCRAGRFMPHASETVLVYS